MGIYNNLKIKFTQIIITEGGVSFHYVKYGLYFFVNKNENGEKLHLQREKN